MSLLHTPQEYTLAVREKDLLFYLQVERFKIFLRDKALLRKHNLQTWAKLSLDTGEQHYKDH